MTEKYERSRAASSSVLNIRSLPSSAPHVNLPPQVGIEIPEVSRDREVPPVAEPRPVPHPMAGAPSVNILHHHPLPGHDPLFQEGEPPALPFILKQQVEPHIVILNDLHHSRPLPFKIQFQSLFQDALHVLSRHIREIPAVQLCGQLHAHRLLRIRLHGPVNAQNLLRRLLRQAPRGLPQLARLVRPQPDAALVHDLLHRRLLLLWQVGQLHRRHHRQAPVIQHVLEFRDELPAPDIPCDMPPGQPKLLPDDLPALRLLVDIMSTAPIKRLELFQDLLPLLRAADLVIALCQNRNPFRYAQVIERTLEHVGLYHIHIRLCIRQTRFHNGRYLHEPRKPGRIQTVMPCQHLISPGSRADNGRDQDAMLPDALHHVVQPLPFVQMERMVMERLYALHREHLHSLPRCRRLPACQHVHCIIEHFPFRCISLHPRSPPSPGPGMPHTPRSPAHTPKAACCNRRTPPP